MVKLNIKFCPVCGEGDVILDESLEGVYRCKKCGFRGAIFPEKEIKQNINNKNKQKSKSK